MNADTLLQNLDVLIEAPDGIEKLRELILRLAAKGLMIEPSLSEKEVVEFIASNDESASKPELKSFCNSRGKFVYQIQIADATDLVQQAQSKIKTNQIKQSGAYPVVDQGQQFISGFIDGIAPINASDKAVLVFGDHTRNIKYIDFDFVVGADGVKVLRTKYLDPKFFYYMARSINLPSRGYGRHYRAFCSSYIPVFSQKEQMMTVSTIEKLMALCDQLEKQQKQRDNLRTATRKSAIDAIYTATTPEELEAAWKRINNNWEVFAGTPESVESLRSLILELAVSGKFIQGVGSWDERTLGQVTKIRTGKLDANASSPDGEYPFFTCAKSPLKISTFSYDTECVLLAGNGNFDVNYYSGKFDAYQRTYIIEAKNKDELFIPYLFRFMQGHSKKLLEQSIGGVIKYIKIGFLTDAPLLLPSYSEQKQIVSKVEELMALCDQLEVELKVRSEVAEKFARSVVSAA